MIDIATSVATPLAKGTLASVTSSNGAAFETALSALTLTAAPFEPDVLYAGPDGKPAPAAPVPTTPPPIDTTRYADVVLLDLSGKRQRIAGGGKDMPPTSAPIPEADAAATKDVIRSPTAIDLPVPATPIPYADVVLLDMSGKRQRKAGAGEGVPVPAKPADTDTDATKDVIWSPVAMVPLPPSMMPMALPKSGGAIAPAVGDGTSPVLAAPVLPASPAAAGGQVGDATAKSLRYTDSAPAAAGEAPAAANVAFKGDPAVPIAARDSVKIELPVRIDAAIPPAVQQSAPAPITQLAGQAFAAAIAAVVQSRRDEREPGEPRAPLVLAAAALEAVHKPVVAATADAKQGALDLRQDSGLQGMIDRIETLRDDANARDTRIRLVPDALGAVDVSVRKDGERVHVHFAAENQASARLLSEAQPRLADLAEARGVKLGQTTVGSGTDSNAGNARQQQADRILPSAPAAILAADAHDTTDTRIA